MNKEVTKYNRETDLDLFSPFHNKFGLEFGSLINRLFDDFWENPSFLRDRNWRYCDFREDKDNFYIDVELPGFSKDQIKVTTKGNGIVISAKNDKSTFVRSFYDNNWDLSKISSKLENGILTVSLGKTEQSKEKLIEIQEVK